MPYHGGNTPAAWNADGASGLRARGREEALVMDQARRELAHLLRRAGFGATPAELDAAVRLGYDTVVDRLLHPEAVEDAEAPLADLDETVQPLEGLRLAWLTRMLHTRRPLQELLELFTLGIGNYDEHDVQEAARAFTGWTLDREGRFTLNARQHDDGLKTIFGRTGPWTGDDVIDL